MGVVLGTLSAFCYAVGSILYRLGQRTRPHDDGQIVSNTVNVCLLSLWAVFIAWGTWTVAGTIGLVLGGLFGTVFGRYAQLRTVRLIGPTRASTFSAATPVTTAIAGWLFLGEAITLIEAIGGTLAIVGLAQIVRSRTSALVSSDQPVPISYYVVAVLAPILFGLAVFFRKWGLERMPGAVQGAFIGSAAGWIALVAWAGAAGRIRPIARDARERFPWAFAAAGVTSTLAMVTQFLALGRTEAWVVGVLAGTMAIWTPILSRVFLGQDERFHPRLFASIAFVFAGVAIIAVD